MRPIPLPLVSVVVPTCGRPFLLQRCLEALAVQTLAPRRYEIVVADDGRECSAEQVVQYMRARGGPVVRYVAVTGQHGPAAARNQGWRAGRGRLIAFTDDDTIPDRRWLEWGSSAFGGDVAGVWGRIVVPLPATPTDYERDVAGLSRSEAATANCFYRRSVLEAVKGFDESFKTAWREDSDLFFTVLERCGRVVHEPRAMVVHPVRPACWGVSLSQQRKSMYNALLYKKHPRLYRQRIQRSAPTHYYAAVFGAALLAGGVAAGYPPWGALGASLWLGVTARFCGERLRGTRRSAVHVLEMVLTSALIPFLSVFWRLRGALKYRVLFF